MGWGGVAKVVRACRCVGAWVWGGVEGKLGKGLGQQGQASSALLPLGCTAGPAGPHGLGDSKTWEAQEGRVWQCSAHSCT